MKILIRLVDQKKLEAHARKYCTALGTAETPEAAGIMVTALARHYGAGFSVYAELPHDLGFSDCSVLVCGAHEHTMDIISIIDRLSAGVKRRQSERAALRRKSRFRESFCLDIQKDYEGWKVAIAKMEDEEFRKAMLDERYEDAKRRAKEIGLTRPGAVETEVAS